MAIGDKYINVNIYLHKKGFVPAGIITFNDKKNYSTFSYFKEYKIKEGETEVVFVAGEFSDSRVGLYLIDEA